MLGTYNPMTDPAEIKVDAERASRWLDAGALPSDTARALLKRAGVAVKPSKKAAPAGAPKPAAETPEEPAAPAAEEQA
jgi:ribosomal protein S16